VIDNIEQIKVAKAASDLVMVTIHGGNEYFPYPRPGLRKLCHFYVDQGADAVICHHPHVPGAYEIYQGRPIVYSLGNLVFSPRVARPGWDQGYAVLMTYDIVKKELAGFEILPYTQSVAHRGVRKMQGAQRDLFFDRLDGYSDILNNEERYKEAWSGYCGRQRNDVLMRQYFPLYLRGLGALGRWLDPGRFFLSSKATKSVKRGMLFCDSHLELLKSVVDAEFRGQ
jgi:hypothetical protein